MEVSGVWSRHTLRIRRPCAWRAPSHSTFPASLRSGEKIRALTGNLLPALPKQSRLANARAGAADHVQSYLRGGGAMLRISG